MHICRVVIKRFRNLKSVDVALDARLTCIAGENNSGKSNFLYALRLAVDSDLPGYFRRLSKEDITDGVDISKPTHVMVGVQFTDFDDEFDEGRTKEFAFAQSWVVTKNLAQVCYRFRPRPEVREQLEADERKSGDLTIADYDWELAGGAVPDKEGSLKDLAAVQWNDNFTSTVQWSTLSAYNVMMLPAIRDVESDLRRSRVSPLQRLIEVADLPEASKEELVNMVRAANQEVSRHKDVTSIAREIECSFSDTVGPAYSMKVKLGMASPTFSSVARNLSVLLSGHGLADAEAARNGLGLNNALYISMLLKYLDKEASKPGSAGRLLLVEEPEAHLHPQLQRVIFSRLLDKDCQVIATTHSTHVTARAQLPTYLLLVSKEKGTSCYRPGLDSDISDQERADLERYLDATKSVLLFARGVILVEGMSEVFLVPELVRRLMEVDLEERGVSVVPIHGVHFAAYMKLFGPKRIERKCAVLTDGDLKPSDARDYEDSPGGSRETLQPYENEFVKVYACSTTFERAVAKHGNLAMFSAAARELGASGVAKKLDELGGQGELAKGDRSEARDLVLRTALRLGKARFAQVAARHADLAKEMPKYIQDAVNWVLTCP
jgi:putative ATP-dependent endonuclease of OLD family